MRMPQIPSLDLPLLGQAGFLLIIGLVGGLAGHAIGLPMPFLLGSVVTVGAWTVYASDRLGRDIRFPQLVRKGFVAIIGTKIGASFSPDLLSVLPQLWPSFLAMVVYVFVAQAVGYGVYRHLGGYDRITAGFSAMPGGLIEAISMGEQAGADVKLLTIQQFARIILVVFAVPILFLLWLGESVGSAAGQMGASEIPVALDFVLIGTISLAGIWLGVRLRLPAAHMIGPVLVSAALHALGLVDTVSPTWLLYLAQLVVGTGLGALFAGATAVQMLRGFGLGAVSVGLMLAIGLGMSLALAPYVPVGLDALFISFAPGGVTEMGLIALSLGVSPVIVTAHHLFRITLTVGLVTWFAHRVRGPDSGL